MKKLILSAALLAAVSCVRFDADEVLLPREDISITMKGEELFTYNPLTCQMSQNPAAHEYRVHDDKLSKWMIVRCNERPANEGQELSADVSWTADKSTRSMNSLEFRVEKIDETGKIWMWCKKKSIGIVIKNL